MTELKTNNGVEDMLKAAGYSDVAIKYHTEQPYMGSLENADIVSGMTGTCGDTMKIFLKTDNDIIQDARYQVLGCAGAISSAMAIVDIVKGKTLQEAKGINDGDVFKVLENIPEKKHHCIQLSVKTLHKAIDEKLNGSQDISFKVADNGSKPCGEETAGSCSGIGSCCGQTKLND